MTYPGNILIIDDEASLRHTLTRILRQAGWEVTSAADGLEALRLLSLSSFDLVYLDIRMPGMDGLQVLKEIRQSYPKLAVILLTAHGSLKTALEAIHLGATDYLLKPIGPETLINRTKTALREQAVERRRNEIMEQINILQDELRALDIEYSSAQAQTTTFKHQEERFLNRGKLILDLQAQRVTFGETLLTLPPTSFEYLAVLTRHAPSVVEYQTLVTEAQGYHIDPNEARELAKWHIHMLRQAIETDPQKPQYVLNVRGVGYRLLVD